MIERLKNYFTLLILLKFLTKFFFFFSQGNGGWTYIAYEYVISAGGQDSLNSYPYTAKNGKCDFKKADVEAEVKSWHYVTRDRDEAEMKKFVGTTGKSEFKKKKSSILKISNFSFLKNNRTM